MIWTLSRSCFPQLNKKSEEERLLIVFKVEHKPINQRAERKIYVLHSRHYFPETTVDGFHLNHLTTCLRKVSPHVHISFLSTWGQQWEVERLESTIVTTQTLVVGVSDRLQQPGCFQDNNVFPQNSYRSSCVLRGRICHLNICQLNKACYVNVIWK